MNTDFNHVESMKMLHEVERLAKQKEKLDRLFAKDAKKAKPKKRKWSLMWIRPREIKT